MEAGKAMTAEGVKVIAEIENKTSDSPFIVHGEIIR